MSLEPSAARTGWLSGLPRSGLPGTRWPFRQIPGSNRPLCAQGLGQNRHGNTTSLCLEESYSRHLSLTPQTVASPGSALGEAAGRVLGTDDSCESRRSPNSATCHHARKALLQSPGAPKAPDSAGSSDTPGGQGQAALPPRGTLRAWRRLWMS